MARRLKGPSKFTYVLHGGTDRLFYSSLAQAKRVAVANMRRWYAAHGDAGVRSPLVVYRRRGTAETRTVQLYHVGMGVFRWERAR